MHDQLFVSYARTDREAVRPLVDALRATGLDVWWDENLGAGDCWQQQLTDRLQQCSGFVVAIGQQGASGWIGAEVGVALSRHFSRDEPTPPAIVPVLLGETTAECVPPFLALFQTGRLTDPSDPQQTTALARRLRDGALADYRRPELPESLLREPFPGLEPFDERHQPLFLGRSIETYEALKAFNEPRTDRGSRRWLRIEGNSGSGKSSLLRAGLLPALQSGWKRLRPHHALRTVGMLRPGHHPLFNLARVLERFDPDLVDVESTLRKPGTRLANLLSKRLGPNELPLLVIDQFEELFTLTTDPDERLQLDRLLAQAVEHNDLPLYLVTTMRSDFLGEFDATPRLNSLRDASARYELPTVTAAGLQDILNRAVDLVGYRYSDDELPKDILNEAIGKPGEVPIIEPGALPLVSNLLRLLCDRSGPDHVLQREHYKQLGRLGGALSGTADQLIESLNERDRESAMRLLLALVEPGRNTQNSRRSITRRQAIDSAGGGESGEQMLRLLSATQPPGSAAAESSPIRLVTIDAASDRVDLIHETLLRRRPDGEPYWKRLHERIEGTSFLQNRARLELQAAAWNDPGSDVPLARGRELRAFLEHRSGVDDVARRYLESSLRGHRRRRLLAATGLLALALVAAVAVEGWRWLGTIRNEAPTAGIETLVARWRLLLGAPERPRLVDLAGGTFEMGSERGTGYEDEWPRHPVSIAPFSIGATEVTFSQYDTYVLDCKGRLGDPGLPSAIGGRGSAGSNRADFP